MSTPVSTLSTTNGQLNLVEVWKVAHTTKSEALHCACPLCIHLEDVPHGEDARAARGIVQKTVDGATRDVYRPPKGAQIYLASCSAGGDGIVVCTECYKASKEEDRAEWWRECVGKMHGSGADADADARFDFVRVPAMERVNDTHHEEGAKLAELAEFGKDSSVLAQGVDGSDDARRKEEIKRRHAATLVAKKAAASKAVDKANAETLLARYRNGCTIDPEGKEEDESVDVGDEDGDEALKVHAECDGDVQTMRAQFPKYAEKWFGRAPTDEETAAQASLVEKLASEADAAKAKFEAVQGELKELEKQLVEDLEEEAFGDDAPPKKGRGKRKQKDVDEMTLEEAVEHEERRRRNAETRRKSVTRRREMLEEHPKLLARAEKCDAVQVQLEETKGKLETCKRTATGLKDKSKEMESQLAALTAQLAATNKKLEKKEASYDRLKDGTVSFFEDPEGKPPGWNAEDLFNAFQAHVRRHKSTAKGGANGGADADADGAKA